MAIHAITGVMGSGKSYEAVSEKIVPALRDEEHRRIVTNIEGLSTPAIAAFIGRPEADVEARLVRISYERVTEPGFWYDPDAGATDTLVQPGDLVVLDEVWRYFNRGTKLPDDAMRFFRMHRHYVGAESGLTCDVVLINQALRGIHQDIRDVVEVQFACRKLKVLGRPQNYQVLVHEGGDRNASHTYLRKYSDKVFPLYSSYTQGGAKESIDKRQSALNKPFFKLVLPLAALAIAVGSYGGYSYFKDMGKGKGTKASAAASAASSPVTATSPPAPGQPAPTSFGSPSATADAWRLVARYSVSGLPVVILVDGSGRYRTVTSGSYSQGASNDVSVAIPAADPTRASPWTGSFAPVQPVNTSPRGAGPSK